MPAPRDDDPFAPEADPYPSGAALGRRGMARLALAAPLVLAACRGPRDLVCAPRTGDAEHCVARFCRYHADRG